MGFRLFGLTGGVASGKSRVAAWLRVAGVDVIDADVLARQAVEPGTDGLAEIVAAFGRGVLAADGTLDRKALGVLVFADTTALQRLNSIVHPRIAAETMRLAQALQEQGRDLACYEAALIVENGLANAFRPLVVVAADPATQLSRIIARDHLDEGEARRRIAAQMPLARKMAVADYVIDNNGSLADLEVRAAEVLADIRARLQGDQGDQASA